MPNNLHAELTQLGEILFDAGKKAENKEWLEGRRCEICGEPKKPNSSSMCDKCWENG